MSELELFHRLGAALAIGLLIGLERGWKAREAGEGERTAGLRTFALTGLMGGISGAIAAAASPLLLAPALVVFAAAFILFSWREARAQGDLGATTVVAGLLTFLLGAYAVLGDLHVAVAAAVAMAVLLALKKPLHSWIEKLTWPEIRAVLILLAMSFLFLPLLPDRKIDPWQTINPAEIWLLAILIAGLSFAGYVAVKLIGDQAGLALAAVAGGLTSSTATTVSFARWGKAHDDAAPLLAGGILIAGVIMMIRVVVIAGALNPSLILGLAVPLGAAGLVTAVIGLFLILRPAALNRNGKSAPPKLELKNPLDLGMALKMAALIAIIMLISELATTYIGAHAIYPVAAISGVVDVDALTLSMARISGRGGSDAAGGTGGQISAEAAIIAILLAAGVNTVAKAAMAAGIGGKRLGLYVGGANAIALVVMVLMALIPVPRDLGFMKDLLKAPEQSRQQNDS
ncbi:MgtC/SapB family protein [Dongia soli]|uniref:DUF4010 domain-containing protein n=1 Tax=Dongia soli TaxID=600628 RepID=A0ABU5EH03_9PROT|nr:DUF4010 domain-containing protein [Dongia soli]MDY0884646.1 DUF4010 domain-containing protein [Dongia soli]